MPELFCGFERRSEANPTLYPVACAPQSWAAAAVLLLLEAALGIEIDAPARRLHLARPRLPRFLDRVEIRGLAIGDAALDLRLHRHDHGVSVDLLERRGAVEVTVVK